MTPRAAAVVLLLALAIGGCGVSDPYNDRRREAAAQPSPTATATAGADERTSGQAPPSPDLAAGARPAPDTALPGGSDASAIEAAIRQFANRYMNWEWDTFAQSRRDLVTMSTGSLRTQMRQTAQEIETEIAKRPSNQANEGSIEGILRRKGKPIFVVTREVAKLGTSVQQRSYVLYLASVERADGKWKLSDWRSVTL